MKKKWPFPVRTKYIMWNTWKSCIHWPQRWLTVGFWRASNSSWWYRNMSCRRSRIWTWNFLVKYATYRISSEISHLQGTHTPPLPSPPIQASVLCCDSVGAHEWKWNAGPWRCEAGQAWWWAEGSRPVEEGHVQPLGIVAAHVAVLGPWIGRGGFTLLWLGTLG